MRTITSRSARLTGSAITITLGFGLWVAPIAAQDGDNASPSRVRDSDRLDDDSISKHDSSAEGNRTRPGPKSNHHSALGVTLSEDVAGNLYIRRVMQGSPAEDAGLRKGDEILTVDGHRVSHTDELKRALARAGETVELGILRKGRHGTVEAKLADPDEVFHVESGRNSVRNELEAQANANSATSRSHRRSTRPEGDTRRNFHGGAALGITLDRGPRDGAWVSDVYPNSPADEAGLRAGDDIIAIDGRYVDSAEAVIHEISQRHPGDQITIDFDRNGREKSIKAKLVRHHDDREGRVEQSRRNDRRDRRNGSDRSHDDSDAGDNVSDAYEDRGNN